MSAHTPGPLFARSAKEGGDYCVRTQDNDVVAEFYEDIRKHAECARDEAKANAMLFAAATDLLATLEAVLADVQNIDNDHALSPQVGRQVRAAILKAKGEPS